MADSRALSFARLVDWVEGRLSDEEARAVAEYVATASDAIRADVAWLRTFFELSATMVSAAPPAETHALLVRHFEAYAQSRQPAGPLRQIVATLTFDSGLHTALAGIRAPGVQASQRQLAYSTDIADIVLNIQPRPHDQNLDLNGQIFPKTGLVLNSFTIQLLPGTGELAGTPADELGEFRFEAVPPDRYDLTLQTQQINMLIAAVEVRI